MVTTDKAVVEPRRKPKSRDGCQRCKIKRLKCDETKPECRNCVGRGVACPGYRKLIKWSTKYEAYMPGASRGLVLGPNQVLEDRALRGGDAGGSAGEGARGSAFEIVREERPGAGRVRKRGGRGKGGARRREMDGSGGGGEERGEEAASAVVMGGEEEECVDTEGRGHPEPNMDAPHTGEPIADLPPLDLPAEPPFEPPAWDDATMEPPALEDFPLDMFDLDVPNIDWTTLDVAGEEEYLHDQPPNDPADAEQQQQQQEAAAPDDIPRLNTPLSRALIRSYARASYPPSPIPPTLIEPGMALVEHYFQNVCMLYSAFDSSLNPFRSAVARIWDSSPAIFYAIQAMAAAQLSNTHPAASALGRQLRRQAHATLDDELARVAQGRTSSERALLAILLLGLSACWLDCTDLGIANLRAARSLIYPRLLNPVPPQNVAIVRQNQFFEESLIYWEMLIGFVSQEGAPGPPLGRWSTCHVPGGGAAAAAGAAATPATASKLLPHPWTGIAPQVQTLFAEVGRLIRCERLSHLKHHRNPPNYNNPHPYTLHTQRQACERILVAAQLEEALLNCSLPREDDMVDFGDRNTTKADFVALGEAYRCAGLLELYRVFPPLLGRRLGSGGACGVGGSGIGGVGGGIGPAGAEVPWGWWWERSNSNSSIGASVAAYTPTSTTPFAPQPRQLPSHSHSPTHHLTSLALHILSLLSHLPPSSGTCSTQPILLVAAASELRLHPQPQPQPRPQNLDFLDLSSSTEECLQPEHLRPERISQARAFVEERLEEFMRRLPRQPLLCMRRLVREVWWGLDRRVGKGGNGGDGEEEEEEEVFWLDVAWERGWLTVMG